MFMKQSDIEKIKAQYQPGKRIVLTHMADDPHPIPDGTKGTVKFVDDAGQIHCAFDNGRHQTIIPEADKFHLLPTVRPMTQAEKLYCYTQSQELISKTGCIGHLRADMGTFGEGFFSSWDDHRTDLNTQEFKDQINPVIDALRLDDAYDGILKSRNALAAYCKKFHESIIDEDGHAYGFRADTEKYTYMLRLNPHKGEYNLYCYCYLKEWLDNHMKRAESGIRFTDNRFHNKFVAADGSKVRYILSNSDVRDMVVRYIDDHHFEANAEWGKTIYHISEFADAYAKHCCKDIYLL